MTASSYRSPVAHDHGMTLCLLFALLALADALFNYFWTGNGIHGSEGALLVVVSSLLMLAAAGLIVARWVRGWLRGLFETLLALDFVGSALAAYLLEAWILVILIALSALAWIAHLMRPSGRASNLG